MQFYLAAIPDHLSQSALSIIIPHVRPISHGQQCYTPNPLEFPVGQPMTKVSAKLQVSRRFEEALRNSVQFVYVHAQCSVQGRQNSQLTFPP